MIKELIKKVFNLIELETYEELDNECDKLKMFVHDYEVISEQFRETRDELFKAIEDLAITQQRLEVAEAQIQELLKEKTLNILDLQQYYEGKRRQDPWRYNGGRLGTADVKLYLKPSDLKPFEDWAKQYINTHKLWTHKNITNVVSKVYEYWVYANWRYRYDKDKYNTTEYWEDPTKAFKDMSGDCEDKALAMYWTIICVLRELGMKGWLHEWRLTFVATHVLGEGGHALLTWLHDDGEYYAIESTYDEKGSFLKTWLNTPVRFNNMYGSFWGFATYYKSWVGGNTDVLDKFIDGGK